MAQKWRVAIITSKLNKGKRGIGIERYRIGKPDEVIYFNAFTFTGSNREAFEAALEVVKERSNGSRVDLVANSRARNNLKAHYPLIKFTFSWDVKGFARELAIDATNGIENSEQLISEEELK